MRVLFFIIIVLSPILLLSQLSSEQIFERANKYYTQEKYDEAIADYQELLSKGLHSSELYYNLANAEYKSNQLAKAILYYEKAKLLSPNNISINKNLNLAREKVDSDILEIPDFLPLRLWRAMAKSLSPTSWIILQCLMGILLLYGIYLYFNQFLAPSNRTKGLVFASASLALLIICYSAGSTSHNLLHLHNHGVVIKSATMYSAPDKRSEEIELLSEGVKVKLLDKIESWHKIELMNKNTGWIELETIERI